jgi:hypothetical protein
MNKIHTITETAPVATLVLRDPDNIKKNIDFNFNYIKNLTDDIDDDAIIEILKEALDNPNHTLYNLSKQTLIDRNNLKLMINKCNYTELKHLSELLSKYILLYKQNNIMLRNAVDGLNDENFCLIEENKIITEQRNAYLNTIKKNSENEFRNNIEKQKIQEKIMNEKRLEIRKAKLTKQDYRSIIRKFNK